MNNNGQGNLWSALVYTTSDRTRVVKALTALEDVGHGTGGGQGVVHASSQTSRQINAYQQSKRQFPLNQRRTLGLKGELIAQYKSTVASLVPLIHHERIENLLFLPTHNQSSKEHKDEAYPIQHHPTRTSTHLFRSSLQRTLATLNNTRGEGGGVPLP